MGRHSLANFSTHLKEAQSKGFSLVKIVEENLILVIEWSMRSIVNTLRNLMLDLL